MRLKRGWHIETARAAKKFVASIDTKKDRLGLPKQGEYRRLVMEHLGLDNIEDIPAEYESAYGVEWIKRNEQRNKEPGDKES